MIGFLKNDYGRRSMSLGRGMFYALGRLGSCISSQLGLHMKWERYFTWCFSIIIVSRHRGDARRRGLKILPKFKDPGGGGKYTYNG